MATETATDPLIDQLRQPSLARSPGMDRYPVLKNSDTQRERYLQPLVGGIGASARETRCSQVCDEPGAPRGTSEPPAIRVDGGSPGRPGDAEDQTRSLVQSMTAPHMEPRSCRWNSAGMFDES